MAAPRPSGGAGPVRRLLGALGHGVVVLSLLAAALTVAGLGLLQLRGEQVMVVASGSMAPAFRAGDAVVVRPPRPPDLRVGAVVSFHAVGDPERLTTHRIVARHPRPEGLFLQTQGDANPTPDPDFAPASSVVGVMTRPVPWLGYWLAFFQSPLGRTAVLGLPLVLLGLAQLRSTVRQLRRSSSRRRPVVPATATVAVVVVSMASGAVLARHTSALFNDQQGQGGNAFTTASYCGNGMSYQQSVNGDSPLIYHRFSETGGTTTAANNGSSGSAGTYSGGYTLGVPGATACETTSTAVRLDGSTGQVVTASTTATASTNTFTLEAWFRTTTGGGKILGWGNSRTGASATYDRHLYLSASGALYFGVNPSARTTITSPGPYTDGRWHHVAATLGATGMRLYVDGVQVATGAATSAGTAYNGYWRIGYDTLTGWTGAPANPRFTGDLDEVAVYPSALTLAQVSAHYAERFG